MGVSVRCRLVDGTVTMYLPLSGGGIFTTCYSCIIELAMLQLYN